MRVERERKKLKLYLERGQELQPVKLFTYYTMYDHRGDSECGVCGNMNNINMFSTVRPWMEVSVWLIGQAVIQYFIEGLRLQVRGFLVEDCLTLMFFTVMCNTYIICFSAALSVLYKNKKLFQTLSLLKMQLFPLYLQYVAQQNIIIKFYGYNNNNVHFMPSHCMIMYYMKYTKYHTKICFNKYKKCIAWIGTLYTMLCFVTVWYAKLYCIIPYSIIWNHKILNTLRLLV